MNEERHAQLMWAHGWDCAISHIMTLNFNRREYGYMPNYWEYMMEIVHNAKHNMKTETREAIQAWSVGFMAACRQGEWVISRPILTTRETTRDKFPCLEILDASTLEVVVSPPED